ncbi:hypothetical protein PIB30_067443, partial [Stylosanthes scabra]|nr:hypothetical protein [Stylosanthes scabra]
LLFFSSIAARRLSAIASGKIMEDWKTLRINETLSTTPRKSSGDRRALNSCYSSRSSKISHGHRFLNFLLACMVVYDDSEDEEDDQWCRGH